MRSLTSLLVRSGVLELSNHVLRVAPRFQAHAEETAQRLRAQGRWIGPAGGLEAALATWDDYLHDVRAGALAVWEFMADHDQGGALAPAFPGLERFGRAAA